MSEGDNAKEVVREEVLLRLAEAEKVIAGLTSDEIPEDDGFSGVVMDANIDNPTEQAHILEWLVKIVGPLETLKTEVVLELEGTRMVVYEGKIGVNELRLVQVQNPEERVQWILWPEEMVDGQREAGYVEADLQ